MVAVATPCIASATAVPHAADSNMQPFLRASRETAAHSVATVLAPYTGLQGLFALFAGTFRG
jgi:hypothetical protein